MYLKEDDIESYIKKLKLINWKGLKLWLVGGVLEGWETRDIDICLTGDRIDSIVFDGMQKAREIGPFDMYYPEKVYTPSQMPFVTRFAKSYDRGHKNARQRPGEWVDGLFWQKLRFPMDKHKKRKYTKEPLLIHDGTL